MDFAEVTPERCSVDVEDLRGQLEGEIPVVAVSATHVYGHPAEVEALEAAAADRGIPVVYDAAHALGSQRAGAPIGGFGVAEVFSLSPTKVVVAGEGGVVTTNDEGLAEAIRLGRDYGNPGDYDCRFPGLNARMSELHAAVALASLADLDRHIDRREELVHRFEEGSRAIPGLRVVRQAPGDRSTHKDLTMLVDPDACGVTSSELRRTLAAEGIDSRRYYAPPIHQQAAYTHRWPRRRPLPITDQLASQVLSPPLWSHLSDDALDGVLAAVARIHEHAPAVQRALQPESP